jgi:HSP20 family molecular chaperone IbpA
MSSFYEKLSMKLQETDPPLPGGQGPSGVKSVTYRATGDRTAPDNAVDATAAAAAQPAEAAPDGTDSIDVDLFQSDARIIVIMPLAGIPASACSIVLDEESNTMTVEAVQRRPNLPLLAGTSKEDASVEKGIYAKQEIKWKSLYRKVYLPASFDSGSSEAFLRNGILMVVLPTKHPGAGKKLVVQEVVDKGSNQ